eukprot:5165709-Pyramimonas_sp.AAC.1
MQAGRVIKKCSSARANRGGPARQMETRGGGGDYRRRPENSKRATSATQAAPLQRRGASAPPL